MNVNFKQAEALLYQSTEVHYDPIGWKLRSPDARTIITAFQIEFGTDFSVHCDEEGQEYSTSYDNVQSFLARASLEGDRIDRISCVIPIRGESYHAIIDFRKNTLYTHFNGYVEGEPLLRFDPVMQMISLLLSKNTLDNKHNFQKRIKRWEMNERRPSSVEFIFRPAKAENHDMIVLEAFDQRFRLGMIHTKIWDRERRPWRTFDGFEQYRAEAPADESGLYAYLDGIDFVIPIDDVQYRVWIDLNDRSSLSSIKIEYDGTDYPYDFAPIMQEIAARIPQRE